MRELQLILSDDLIYAQTGNRIPAAESVTVSLDGRVRELDLTAEHAKELRELLEPWLNAGHPPGGQPAPGTSGTSKGFRGGAYMLSRARQKAIRDFADERGLKSEDGKRPIYRTPGGGYYYPYKLRKMFEGHIAEQQERSA